MLTIKGMPELIQNLRDLEVHIPDALASAGFYAMNEIVLPVATHRCPVDTGKLAASIYTKVTEKSPRRVNVQTGTSLFYGYLVEFGTGKYNVHGDGRQTPWAYDYKGHKGPKGKGWTYKGKHYNRWTEGQRPQPFLIPALEMNANKIPDAIAWKLNRIIEEAARNRKMSALANYYGG